MAKLLNRAGYAPKIVRMSDRLDRAFAAVDSANAEDPTTVVVDGEPVPAELLYGRRMSAWLDRLVPDATEPLRIAVRAQHIQRWKIPRSAYPEGRAGYKRWRSELARVHAELAGKIAAEAGYDDVSCERVRDLVQKRRLHSDLEAQTLEDVACLVFLEHYFADFQGRHERAKVVEIVRKTWGKMSERGRGAALGLALGDAERSLVEEALAADETLSTDQE